MHSSFCFACHITYARLHFTHPACALIYKHLQFILIESVLFHFFSLCFYFSMHAHTLCEIPLQYFFLLSSFLHSHAQTIYSILMACSFPFALCSLTMHRYSISHLIFSRSVSSSVLLAVLLLLAIL